MTLLSVIEITGFTDAPTFTNPFEALKWFMMFSPINQATVAAVQHYMQTKYPEAIWTIEATDNGRGVTAKFDFVNAADRSFYLLKWGTWPRT